MCELWRYKTTGSLNSMHAFALDQATAAWYHSVPNSPYFGAIPVPHNSFGAFKVPHPPVDAGRNITVVQHVPLPEIDTYLL